jgi:hypothetical protein
LLRAQRPGNMTPRNDGHPAPMVVATPWQGTPTPQRLQREAA